MPGALTNPTLNPFQSYLEFNNGSPTAEQDYQSGLSKGYEWTGSGWKFGGGTDQTNWTDAMKKGAAAAEGGRWGAGGAPMSGPSGLSGGGGPGGGSTTSLATGSSFSSGGPYKADAQLAQVQSQFDDILKRGMGSLNEAAAISGGFSGGIPFENRQKYITDIGMQRGSAIERILNDITGRNQSYELEKQRLADAAKSAMYGSGGSRFSSGTTGGNQNQDILALFQQMMGGGGSQAPGGYSSKGDTFSDNWGGNMGDLPKGQLPAGSTTGGQQALSDLKAQYNMMKSVNPAGAEALKAQIYALGGSV